MTQTSPKTTPRKNFLPLKEFPLIGRSNRSSGSGRRLQEAVFSGFSQESDRAQDGVERGIEMCAEILGKEPKDEAPVVLE